MNVCPDETMLHGSLVTLAKQSDGGIVDRIDSDEPSKDHAPVMPQPRDDAAQTVTGQTYLDQAGGDVARVRFVIRVSPDCAIVDLGALGAIATDKPDAIDFLSDLARLLTGARPVAPPETRRAFLRVLPPRREAATN